MEKKKDAVCNVCGHLCDLNEDDGCSGLRDVTVEGGYDSTAGNGDGALDDLTSYNFSLCEFCLDWLFTQFVVPVKVNGQSEEEVFRPAGARVVEDEWRRMKSHFFTASALRASGRKVWRK